MTRSSEQETTEETGEMFTYYCRRCESDVRLVGEQRGEWGTTERHTARMLLACGCMTCSNPDPDTIPPNWQQDMDYEHPVSAEAEPCSYL